MRRANCSRKSAGAARAMCYAREARFYAGRGACMEASVHIGDAMSHARATPGARGTRINNVVAAVRSEVERCWAKVGR